MLINLESLFCWVSTCFQLPNWHDVILSRTVTYLQQPLLHIFAATHYNTHILVASLSFLVQFTFLSNEGPSLETLGGLHIPNVCTGQYANPLKFRFVLYTRINVGVGMQGNRWKIRSIKHSKQIRNWDSHRFGKRVNPCLHIINGNYCV